MPKTCVVYGCPSDQRKYINDAKSKCSKENETYIAFHRFPLKNPVLLEKWEQQVRKVHENDKAWKSNKYSFICSNHFERWDYTLLPSSNGTCRLKNNAVPCVFPPFSINKTDDVRRRLEMPQKRSLHQEDILSPAAKVRRDHNYCKQENMKPTQQESKEDRSILEEKLKQKIKNLQQQLRRCKKKVESMAEIINELQEKLIIKTELADQLHTTFDKIQLSIFQDTKHNSNCSPCGRRYTDEVKEFALTLYFYSPKAYQYVRSILPLPNPSLIRKWSSSVDCEPGFLKEAFQSLASEVRSSPEKKDCCLIIDAMSIRKQTIWDPQNDQYVGFVNYGGLIPEDPENLASEALVFLLVGTRSHWKCPIGYFLSDKMTSKVQAQLVNMALDMAAEAGLRVWSITADGTSANLSTFRELGCKFGTTYESMVTKFKHPTREYNVFVILDPCHMLKLARNALASLSSFIDSDNEKVKWIFFQNLHNMQEEEGLKLANKLSMKHLQFEKHKMNVKLAAQTLSSSVADAIEFLDISMELPGFKDTEGTVKFARTIDRLFDLLNSRNPLGKGYKQPLRLATIKDIWEPILKSTAHYLLTLKTDTETPQLLSTHRRKTFVVGFVVTIKSTIEMANEMFSSSNINPFKYLLTYKFSQDHIELLFSCIRSRGGWNNNPNCLQLKYALRKMLLRNAVTASKNGNCCDFTATGTTIIPFFHTKKHSTPLIDTSHDSHEEQNTTEESIMVGHLDKKSPTEFISNVLFYIGGFVVSKLVKQLTCQACRDSLVSYCPSPKSDHDYCGIRYNEVAAASAFTLFVNNGGLRIPSKSVYQVIEYAEQVFKANVCKEGREISIKKNLKSRMILDVCNHFLLESRQRVFQDHEHGMNESVFEDDHQTKLIKCTADKYFTLRLFTYGKRYCETIVQNGQPSDRHQLTKLILFKNQ